MATATNKYDRETIQKKRLFGEEIPFEETEVQDTFTIATPAGPVQTAKPPEPEVDQKAIKDFYANRLENDDWLDLESPMANVVRAKQESINRAGEPTALQKKYEEMGLEYDYSKRGETGSIYKQDAEKELENINPDFVQRNREANRVVNLRGQLQDQYESELGRLNAIEVNIWSDPSYAASDYGKNDMALLRQRQQQIENYYKAEDAKLDGQFYDHLPVKDMEVANMLIASGLEGRRMTTYTKNHGDIRDSVNEALLQVPEDKREEFTTKLLGDYVKDDQGNIVRNSLGQELRQGSEVVSVTPYGTYDFKISPKAYANAAEGLFNQFKPKTEEEEIKNLDYEISKYKEDAALREDTDPEKKNLLSMASSLAAQRTAILMNRRQSVSPTFEKQTNEPFISEPETNITTPAAPTAAPTAPTATTTETPTATTGSNINTLVQNAINVGYVKYDDNGELIAASDSEQAKQVLERLKKANIK